MTQCIIDNRDQFKAGSWMGKLLVEYLYIDPHGPASLELEPVDNWLKNTPTFMVPARAEGALSMDEFLVQGSRRQYLFSSMDVRM